MKMTYQVVEAYTNKLKSQIQRIRDKVSYEITEAKKIKNQIDLYKPEYDWTWKITPDQQRQATQLKIKFDYLNKVKPEWIEFFKSLRKAYMNLRDMALLFENDNWLIENKICWTENNVLKPEAITTFNNLNEIKTELDLLSQSMIKLFEPIKTGDPNEFTDPNILRNLQRQHALKQVEAQPTDNKPPMPLTRRKLNQPVELLNLQGIELVDPNDNGECPKEFKPNFSGKKNTLKKPKASGHSK